MKDWSNRPHFAQVFLLSRSQTQYKTYKHTVGLTFFCCHLVLSSCIVQFAALCGFNQASASVERLAQLARDKNIGLADEVNGKQQRNSCACNSNIWISIYPIIFQTVISKGTCYSYTAVITERAPSYPLQSLPPVMLYLLLMQTLSIGPQIYLHNGVM